MKKLYLLLTLGLFIPSMIVAQSSPTGISARGLWDEAKYRQIQQQLTTYGVEFRALSFTSGNRLAAQGLVNAATPAYTQKAQVSTAGLQAKMLSSEEMDSYTIEVRKRDAEKARTALRSIG